jgi:hypothetical protein
MKNKHQPFYKLREEQSSRHPNKIVVIYKEETFA